MSKFAPLDAPGMMRVHLHNVLLVAVHPDSDGANVLVVELDGETRDLRGSGRFSDSWSSEHIGRVGYLARDPRSHLDTFIFTAYVDRTLRRAPELDTVDDALPISHTGAAAAIIGWRCSSWPHGLLAPSGLIPGLNGEFFPDQTRQVTLRLPPEFFATCRGVRRSPEEVLRGFIADVCGLTNYAAKPRADRYANSGNDARLHAEAWLNRSYGSDRVPDEVLSIEDDLMLQRDSDLDELNSILDDFIAIGGTRYAFLHSVHELVQHHISTVANAKVAGTVSSDSE